MTPEDYLLMCDAAKAAGYDIWWKNGTCKGGPYLSAFIGDKPWRPLEDDGDAFRLMVDTNSSFDASWNEGRVYVYSKVEKAEICPACDPKDYPSIRRNILEVAASQGKEMFYA